MRPKLLDLFSGAGGAAMGYYRAGFEVTGAAGRQAVAAELRAEGQRRRAEVSDSGGYGGHYRSIQADECERLARKIEGSTDG